MLSGFMNCLQFFASLSAQFGQLARCSGLNDLSQLAVFVQPLDKFGR